MIELNPVAASRRATAAPLSPSDASVPTAPPNCSRSATAPARAKRSRARASGATQATILKPKLITCAGCISVRASIGVRRWTRASACSVTTRRARSASIRASAFWVAITIAVSMTSWLVLP